MTLAEYLVTKMEISAEDAEKVEQLVREYHHTYGHHGHKEKKPVREDAAFVDLIVESEEQAEAVNYDLSKLHCNGCGRNCALSDPNCGRGRMAVQRLNQENEKN